MNKEHIEQLVEILENNQLDELLYTLKDESIHLVKKRGVEVSSHPITHSLPPASAQEVSLDTAQPQNSESVVTSPIVGTFYSSPSPDKPAFVKVGDRIEPGQTLCIVEAMKILNPVTATMSGTVTAVLVQNESPVQYGQPLLEIQPN